ncbi:MAG: hypothetical protein AB1782_03380, partial [Cyanobacteriota bacterium]
MKNIKILLIITFSYFCLLPLLFAEENTDTKLTKYNNITFQDKYLMLDENTKNLVDSKIKPLEDKILKLELNIKEMNTKLLNTITNTEISQDEAISKQKEINQLINELTILKLKKLLTIKKEVNPIPVEQLNRSMKPEVNDKKSEENNSTLKII